MAAKKPAAKKPAAKKPAVKSARKPSAAFTKEFTPSSKLAELVGAKPLPRTQVIKKLWDYFKKNELNEGQLIKMDDKVKAVYGAKKSRTVGKNKVAVPADKLHMTEVSEAFKQLEG